MAMFDRMRDRLRGGRREEDTPAAYGRTQSGTGGGMPGMFGAQMTDAAGTGGMTETDKIDAILRGQTDEARSEKAARRAAGAEELIRTSGGRLNRDKGTETDGGRLMNRTRLNEATKLLLQYKAGKASVDRRVIRAQQWWKLRNWEQIQQNRGTKGAVIHKSNTGWLWNCIIGKHADLIDAYPEPIILPREKADKEEAQKLSKIVPVVLQINGFESTYNNAGWQKLQEGTGVYGIFWDPQKLNGLGDISIKKENILNLFWEPGINDIQESRNVFFCTLVDKDVLIKQYPELEGQLKTNKLSLEKYRTDDQVDLDKKAVVIDWYYHTYNGTKKILQYCKYVDEICLYSSEEENQGNPEYDGFYEDNEYPFELDALYPVEGSPAGYGMIDVCKDTQSDIDTLSQAMVQNAACRATPRYFIKKDGSINEDEFADWSKPFIHSSGMLGQDSVRMVEVQSMGGDAHNMLQQKIDELKFISGNTDVNNGGVPSGVTAASAIAALKEDSGRSSKDSSKAAYRVYARIVNKVISRIRQFYDIPRQFRIIGQDGNEEFTQFDNSGLIAQPVENGMGVEDELRIPIWDIDVRAQRENAYTKMSQNELALQFYNMGLFAPQMTDQALMLLDMMDFRGKEELRQKLQANGTMQDTLMQVAQIAMALAQKYDPNIAMQLQSVLQGVAADTGMAALPQGGGSTGQKPAALAPTDATEPMQEANENGIVRNARERAANASRPD